jgi:cytochrome c553
MMRKSTLLALGAALSLVVAAAAQSPSQQSRPASQETPRPATAAPVPTGSGAPSSPAAGKTLTAADERQLLTTYCSGCHNDRMKASSDSARKLSFDALDVADLQKDGATWELVIRKLRAGMMPPVNMRRPEPHVLDSMIVYLENELDRQAKPFMPAPGMHRLNRTEYANVVRDLLDLSIDPATYLPSDDSTKGFDNIAGALGLSSTLVEAYVSAAQKISRLAIGEAEPPTLKVYRTPEDTSQDYHVEGLPFGTRGGLVVDHVFPSDGEYVLTITPIFGDNMSPTGFGSVPCEKLEVLLDGNRLQLLDWQGGRGGGNTNCGAGGRGSTAGRSTAAGGAAAPAAAAQVQGGRTGGRGAGGGGRGGNQGMRIRFTTTAGRHTVGATFLATNYAPLLDLDRHFMRSTVQTGPTPGYTFFPHVGTLRIEGPYNAKPATDSPSRRKIFVCTPASAADETACAQRILTSLGTRAFRRPASTADVNLLMGFYRSGRQEGSFDDGIEMALAYVLASPHFIYRIEEEPASVKAGQPYRLSDVDLASRLSFFLWSTGPDDELLKAATSGQLKNPSELERQVRRMLKDPKAEALAVNFAGQWLNLRGLQSSGPLPLVYPDFDDPLRQAMRREVELLFDTIVREDRSIVDLLTANDTFVNERLAKHYGIKNVYGSNFKRVTLPAELDYRRGLLGKGAFLVTSAKPERTSPVTRGKWIMTNILGMSPPDPPPDVPPLPPRSGDFAGNAKDPTMRQKMIDHRVRPDCSQCHQLMDPIGFTLENFDAIGVWRTLDEGQPIDAAAQTFDSTKIDGPAGLRQWLVSKYSDLFITVAVEKLLTYGLGRGLEYQDMPLVRAVARDAIKDGNRFSALVLGVVRSQTFQMNTKATAPAPGQVASVRPDTSEKRNP